VFSSRSTADERERLMRGWRRAVEAALYWARGQGAGGREQ
jgi:hypothetical protein